MTTVLTIQLFSRCFRNCIDRARLQNKHGTHGWMVPHPSIRLQRREVALSSETFLALTLSILFETMGVYVLEINRGRRFHLATHAMENFACNLCDQITGSVGHKNDEGLLARSTRKGFSGLSHSFMVAGCPIWAIMDPDQILRFAIFGKNRLFRMLQQFLKVVIGSCISLFFEISSIERAFASSYDVQDFDCVLYATPDGEIMAKSKLWKIAIGDIYNRSLLLLLTSRKRGNVDRVAPTSLELLHTVYE